MPEHDNQPEVRTDFQWHKDPDYKSVYSNQAQISSTVFEFSMVFGDIVNVTVSEDGIANALVEQRGRVVMSPLHFKIFAVSCMNHVKGYEERFGKITAPFDGENVLGDKPKEPNK